jgi:hypothetical protein
MESVGGINFVKIAKFKEFYSFDESLGDALTCTGKSQILNR